MEKKLEEEVLAKAKHANGKYIFYKNRFVGEIVGVTPVFYEIAQTGLVGRLCVRRDLVDLDSDYESSVSLFSYWPDMPESELEPPPLDESELEPPPSVGESEVEPPPSGDEAIAFRFNFTVDPPPSDDSL